MPSSSVRLIKDNFRNVIIGLGLPYFSHKKGTYFEKRKV